MASVAWCNPSFNHDLFINGHRLKRLERGIKKGADSFTIELTKGSIESQADDYIKFSEDSSGTITMDDGSTLQFDGINRIDW